MADFSSAIFAEYMSRRMQVIHNKNDVFRAIANFEEQATLKAGDTVHRPFKTMPRIVSYTRGTALTMGAMSNSDESLVVNVQKAAPIYIDDLDEMQSNFNLQNEYADQLAIELGNWIDGDVLGEYDQADNKVDDVEMNGGTAGNGFVLNVSNIDAFFATAGRKLDVAKIRPNNRFAVISPQVKEVLLRRLAGKDTDLGDEVGANGKIGRWMGFELYQSVSTGWSATLAFPTIPVAADTIVINGVTLTAAANNSATNAGDFSISTTAALAAANLAALVNGTGTPAAGTYIELSAANRKLLDGITATVVGTTITFKAEGLGYVPVSEGLTPAGDVWTPELQIQHVLFGQKGATDVVIQQRPKVEVKEVPDKLGKNIIPWTMYGLKTFDEGDAMLVDGRVRSDAY